MSPVASIKLTFRALRVRNFRLFVAGQLVSVSGTWMQTVAQGWLVLRLTGSGVAIGIATALQFLPTAIAGLWGGLVADRFDKRKVLVATQALAGVLAVALGVLTATGVVRLWMVYLLAFLLGWVTVFDTPARQAFVVEMVGPGEVANAVALNSAVFNAGRIIGPAVAAALIATVGLAAAFIANGVSYIAVVAGLLLMNAAELFRAKRAPRERGQILEGIRYVMRTPEVRRTLGLVLVVATTGFNFTIVLPLMAKFTFHRGASAYALLTSVMSAGALLGALATARRARPTQRLLAGTAAAFGVCALLAASAPNLGLEAAGLAATGAASMAFISTANSTLQLRAPDVLRGRVMAIYALVFLGSTPIGGPFVGWISERWGARAGLGFGGAASLIAALVAMGVLRRRHARSAPSPNAHTAPAPAR